MPQHGIGRSLWPLGCSCGLAVPATLCLSTPWGQQQQQYPSAQVHMLARGSLGGVDGQLLLAGLRLVACIYHVAAVIDADVQKCMPAYAQSVLPATCTAAGSAYAAAPGVSAPRSSARKKTQGVQRQAESKADLAGSCSCSWESLCLVTVVAAAHVHRNGPLSVSSLQSRACEPSEQCAPCQTAPAATSAWAAARVVDKQRPAHGSGRQAITQPSGGRKQLPGARALKVCSFTPHHRHAFSPSPACKPAPAPGSLHQPGRGPACECGPSTSAPAHVASGILRTCTRQQPTHSSGATLSTLSRCPFLTERQETLCGQFTALATNWPLASVARPLVGACCTRRCKQDVHVHGQLTLLLLCGQLLKVLVPRRSERQR